LLSLLALDELLSLRVRDEELLSLRVRDEPLLYEGDCEREGIGDGEWE
jgi:hypothetical protein